MEAIVERIKKTFRKYSSATLKHISNLLENVMRVLSIRNMETASFLFHHNKCTTEKSRLLHWLVTLNIEILRMFKQISGTEWRVNLLCIRINRRDGVVPKYLGFLFPYLALFCILVNVWTVILWFSIDAIFWGQEEATHYYNKHKHSKESKIYICSFVGHRNFRKSFDKFVILFISYLPINCYPSVYPMGKLWYAIGVY